MGPLGVEKVSADRRFRRWCQDSVCDDDRFARLTADREPARDTVMVDGALVEVHRHGAGARKADALTMPDESRAAEAV